MQTTAVQWKRLSGLLLAVVAFMPALASADDVVTFPDENLRKAVLQALGQTDPPIYASRLAKLTALNAPFSEIAVLTGIEYCTALTSLQLQGNEVSDITLLTKLTKLREVYLRGNNVSSVTALGSLRQLHLVYLEDNLITDISPLATNSGIDSTDVVNLTGNELNQAAYCDYIPEMESRGVTVYRTGVCGIRVVEIPDSNLDRKIRWALIQLMQNTATSAELARLRTGDLYETDLAELTTLDASSAGIADLTGIHACINLVTLNLGGNRIASLSPMSTLTNIISLNISNNAISDLTPLKQLYGLTILQVQNQYAEETVDGVTTRTRTLASLKGLQSLSGLLYLFASDNAISDLTPLEGLAFLQSLSLANNKISDLSPLTYSTSLLALALGGNQISDVSDLAGLVNLLRLELRDNAITDITPLASMTQMSVIDLSNNLLAAVDALASMVHLDNSGLLVSPTEVYLHNDSTGAHSNTITSVTPLAGLTSLAVLTLYNNDISDISALVGNAGLGTRADEQLIPDMLDMRGNQLSQENLCNDIPLLQARDLNVYFDGKCCDETFLLHTDVLVADTGTVDPPTGVRSYCKGDSKKVTATPAEGYRFDHWEDNAGNSIGTANPISVTMNVETYVIAVFGKVGEEYSLTVNVDPADTGTITRDPEPGTGGTYLSNQQVSVTATGVTGYVFDYWDSDTTDTTNPKKITMDGNKTLTAHFKKQGAMYVLTTAVKGNGAITPAAGDHTYEDGTPVPVVAVADLGWRVDHWEGALTDVAIGDKDILRGVVNVTSSITLTAVFVEDGYDYTLSAVSEGNGTVSVSPDGFHRVSDDLRRYKADTPITVSAGAGSGSAFERWTGDLSGDTPQATLVMSKNRSVRAVFSSGVIRTLTITVQGGGSVSPPAGQYTYVDGKQVSLIATPDTGWLFEQWTGDVETDSNITSVTMNGDKNVTAVFMEAPQITSITPSAGAVCGGERITIAGLRLEGASAVTFGGTLVSIVEPSSTSITVQTPVGTDASPNPTGTVAVVVTTPLGEAVSKAGFTFMGQPELGAVIAAKGSAAGGSRVLLRGKNLAIATQVLFGGTAATIDETSREVTRLYVTTPAHAAGLVDVTLLSAMEPAVCAGAFQYVKIPQIYSIYPNQGSSAGGDIVQIAGDGLASPKGVSFDGQAAVVSQTSDTALSVAIPAHAAGTVSVSVTTDGGTATLPDAFNYFTSSASLTCRVLAASTQAVITDATVRLDPVGRVVNGNASGEYVFASIRPDDYSVVVSAPSYETATLAVTVHVDEAAAVVVRLDDETKDGSDCGSIFKRLDSQISEKVLPLSVAELPASTVLASSRLAIRLSASEGVDPATVWAALTLPGNTLSGGVWLPVTAGDNTDGWVLYVPAEPLPAGETVTLTVGALSLTGAIVGPVSRDFVVTVEKSAGDTTALREDASIAALPAVVTGTKSAVYRIGPAGVFDAPVTVQIPVAGDTDASAVEVFYYSESAEHTGWYRGGNVAGWLVPNSMKTVDVGGQKYVEIQVNHSGVVQIGQRSVFGAAVPFDVHTTGSRAAWLALAGVVLVLGAYLARLLRGSAHA